MRVRVIADDSEENKAGQPSAVGRVYSGPTLLTHSSKFKRPKSSSIDFLLQREHKLLNSAVQLALHQRTRRRPEQTVALQWEGNYLTQTITQTLASYSRCSPSHQPLRSCGTRNLHDVHDAKKMHVLVPGVQLDLASLTALQRLPQKRCFSPHIFSSAAQAKTGF